MTVAEIERDHKEAERCRFQRGTHGNWARKWLALYEWSHAHDRVRELSGVRAPAPRSELS